MSDRLSSTLSPRPTTGDESQQNVITLESSRSQGFPRENQIASLSELFRLSENENPLALSPSLALFLPSSLGLTWRALDEFSWYQIAFLPLQFIWLRSTAHSVCTITGEFILGCTSPLVTWCDFWCRYFFPLKQQQEDSSLSTSSQESSAHTERLKIDAVVAEEWNTLSLVWKEEEITPRQR